MTTARTDPIAEDAIYYFPRKTIHPDPEQPRVHPDDELQASIDQLGIITPIIVRPHPEIENEWMIVDGERRWIGARVSEEIPCRIRLDLEDPEDRLITQLTANTGKPLSPIEQARAFKKILDESESLSQAELAKRLGIPRSTIGDRIRLIEIHPAWMKLIESGRLQVSHGPLIHQYRAVPDEYQVKAAQSVTEGQGWQMRRFENENDVIPIADFRKILRGAFRDYVIELDKVRSYKGPILEIEEESYLYSSGGGTTKMKKVKYAADIKLWRPIRRESEKRAKKARDSQPGFAGGQRYESPLDKARKQIKASGYELPVNQSSKLQPGETEILGSNGRWSAGLHPKILIEKLDPKTLSLHQDQGGGYVLVTSDFASIAAAQEAYRTHVAAVARKELAPLRAKLSDKVLADHAIRGPGARALVEYIDADRGEESVVAIALDIQVKDASESDAQRLLSALAACAALEIKIPNHWIIEDKIRSSLGSPAFKVAKAAKLPVVATTGSATEPKSKKQQKREARAAGKQVGDPARAKSSWPDNPNWTDKPADEEEMETDYEIVDVEEEPEAVEA